MERYKRVFPAFREFETAKEKRVETVKKWLAAIFGMIIGLSLIIGVICFFGTDLSFFYLVVPGFVGSAVIWGVYDLWIKEWVDD